MSIRTRIILSAGITFCGLLCVLALSSGVIVLSSFTKLETKQMQQQVGRFQEALINSYEALDSTLAQWAPWDDAYKYIQDHNPDFLKSNLAGAAISDLNLDVIVFLDKTGVVVYGTGFDAERKKMLPISDGFKNFLQPGSQLMKHADPHSKILGLIQLPQGPMVIASRPIVTSNYSGPIRGTLIMGRYLNDKMLEHLAQLTHLQLTARPYTDAQLPVDFRTAHAKLSPTRQIFIKPLNGRENAGYIALPDINDQPTLIVRVVDNRAIHLQGINTFIWFFVSLVVVSVLCFWIIMVVLDRTIFRRINRLATFANAIAAGDLQQECDDCASDEIGALSAAFSSVRQSFLLLYQDLNTIIEATRTGDLSQHAIPDTYVGAWRVLMKGIYDLRSLFAQVVIQMQTTVRRVADTAGDTSQMAGTLSTASQEMALGAQQVAEGAQAQTHSVASVTENMQFLQQAILSVAAGSQSQATGSAQVTNAAQQALQNISQINGMSTKALEETDISARVAQDGAQVVQETIKRMQRVHTVTEDIATQVNALGESSKKIEHIIEIIGGIAKQTSLLALNAAIEAARAGVHGNGFAVVADEIGKLAERSTTQTKAIATLTGSITDGITAVVGSMAVGQHEVLDGVGQADKAGEALTEILKASQKAGDQVKAMARLIGEVEESSQRVLGAAVDVANISKEMNAATEEMTATSAKVLETVTHMTTVTEQSAETAESLSAAAEEQSASAEELTSISLELAEMAAQARELLDRYTVKTNEPEQPVELRLVA